MKIVERNKDLAVPVLRNRLMADVTGFVGDQEQHDDLAIVLVRVE